MPEALPTDLPPRVERAASFLLEAGHSPAAAVAMAHNAFGRGKVHQSARRHRGLLMSPDELDTFAWQLVNRSVMLEGALLSLDGDDVRDGAVVSAHALCEAHRASRGVNLTVGGGAAGRDQVVAARKRINTELGELSELIEAAKPKDAGPLSMETAGGPKANPRVVHLQNRLNSLGHQIQADGKFGEITAEAVKEFQTKIDAEPTGKVDDATAEALRNGGKPKPTPEELENQRKAMAARQQGQGEGQDGAAANGDANPATTATDGGSATTSNGDSPSGSKARTVTIKLSETDSKADFPQGQMPSVCPKCGAPVRKNGVCQRGHRVGKLDEAWSAASRAAALVARREHEHSFERAPYASAAGNEISVGDHVHVPNHVGEESGVFGQVSRRSRRNGQDIAHVKMPDGGTKGIPTSQLDHMSSADQAEHEKNMEAQAPKVQPIRPLTKPKVQSYKPKAGPSAQQMVANYRKMHGKDPSPAMLKKLGLKEGLDPAWGLSEAWSDASRAAAAVARREHGHQKVWMHSDTGHQFHEGDAVKMPGSPTGKGRVVKLVPHPDGAKVLVHAPHGEFEVEPDSLRPADSEYKRSKREDMLNDYRAGDMNESAQTAALSSTHAPIGKGGTNWVTRTKPGNTGQLPAYIQNIRNAIMRGGKSESEATSIAIGTVKRWAGGGGKVSAEVRAAAAKAVAEWEALRGVSKGEKAAKKA